MSYVLADFNSNLIPGVRWLAPVEQAGTLNGRLPHRRARSSGRGQDHRRLHAGHPPRPQVGRAGAVGPLPGPAVTMPTYMWWIAALCQLPFQICFFVGVATWVGTCGTRRWVARRHTRARRPRVLHQGRSPRAGAGLHRVGVLRSRSVVGAVPDHRGCCVLSGTSSWSLGGRSSITAGPCRSRSRTRRGEMGEVRATIPAPASRRAWSAAVEVVGHHVARGAAQSLDLGHHHQRAIVGRASYSYLTRTGHGVLGPCRRTPWRCGPVAPAAPTRHIRLEVRLHPTDVAAPPTLALGPAFTPSAPSMKECILSMRAGARRGGDEPRACARL